MRLWQVIEKEVEIRKDIQLIELMQLTTRKISGYTNDTDAIYEELEKLRCIKRNELNIIIEATEDATETEINLYPKAKSTKE